MRSKFHMAAVALGLWSCLLLSFGGAAPLGLCFESDGRVEVEAMVGGGCGPLATRASEQHPGIESAEHCVSCYDVLVPFESVVSRDKESLAPLPIAAPASLVVVRSLTAWPEPIGRSNAKPAYPALQHLSTIVIRA